MRVLARGFGVRHRLSSNSRSTLKGSPRLCTGAGSLSSERACFLATQPMAATRPSACAMNRAWRPGCCETIRTLRSPQPPSLVRLPHHMLRCIQRRKTVFRLFLPATRWRFARRVQGNFFRQHVLQFRRVSLDQAQSAIDESKVPPAELDRVVGSGSHLITQARVPVGARCGYCVTASRNHHTALRRMPIAMRDQLLHEMGISESARPPSRVSHSALPSGPRLPASVKEQAWPPPHSCG